MLLHAYRRTEPTPVSLYGLHFEFKPNPVGHVVCDIEDDRAIERLLSIAEAYRPYSTDAAVEYIDRATFDRAVAAAPASPPGGDDEPEGSDDIVFDETLLGSSVQPSHIELAPGVTITLGDLVASAFERSGMDREEWNLNDEDDREGILEGERIRLIMVEEAKAKAAAEAAAPAIGADALVISNGETTIDLGTYTEKALRAFAAENGVTLPGGKSTKVADLRLMVAKALAG